MSIYGTSTQSSQGTPFDNSTNGFTSNNVQAAIEEAKVVSQPLDADLTALAALNTTGIVTRTAANTFVTRSIAATSPITITNGNGVSGNPTLAYANSGVTPASYGSSSLVPTVTVSATGHITSVTTNTVDKLYDHWHGTTQYNASQLRVYTNVGTTDVNGRVTFNHTTTGLNGGPALFSSILSIHAIALDNSGSAIQVPITSVQSTSVGQTILRCIRGTSTGVFIGGTVVSAQYVGAGYAVYIEIVGVKA